MSTQQIWKEFIKKLQSDSLTEDDFTSDNKSFLMYYLIGDNREFRRDKIIDANVCFEMGETKHIVTANCDDGLYRFDFISNGSGWELCFIECITIPIKSIDKVPFNNFPVMTEHEIWVRAEKTISRIVYLYNKLKECFDREKALEWFLDGAGEFIAAKSWIPFFEDKKAFIAYMAWCESRINGEITSIESFNNSKCIIRLKDHLWFKVYNCASHLKSLISEKEFKELFEYIWIDRGKQSGWSVDFEYIGMDTVIIFYS
jgi:hypothetical protein